MLSFNIQEPVLHAEAQSRQWTMSLHKLIPKFICITVTSFVFSPPPLFCSTSACPNCFWHPTAAIISLRTQHQTFPPSGCFHTCRAHTLPVSAAVPPAALFCLPSAPHLAGWDHCLQTVTIYIIRKQEKVEERIVFLCCLFKILM